MWITSPAADQFTTVPRRSGTSSNRGRANAAASDPVAASGPASRAGVGIQAVCIADLQAVCQPAGRCRSFRLPGVFGAWLDLNAMKTEIHPEYVLSHVHCSCGNDFYTRSTKPELHVEICSQCHPFYTGKQKLVDTGGRVERFRRRAAKRAR